MFRDPTVEDSPGPREDVLVQTLLSSGQATLQDVLVLLGQLFLHLPLGASQDERLDHLEEQRRRSSSS